MEAGTGIEQWWRSLPIVTKWLFALSMGLTVGANFGLVNPFLLILDFHSIFYKFEIWRLVTPFFYHGKLGFPFVIDMMFLLRYGRGLEETVFFGRTADYVFFLVFEGILLLVSFPIFLTHSLLQIIGYFLNLRILGMALIMAIIYLWSRKNPNVVISFLFGIRFQAFYLPVALVVFNVLLGGFPLAEIMGILVGHVYLFLTEIYPATSGVRLLKTPEFLYNWFPAQVPYQQQQRPQGQQGRHNWGPG